MFRHLARPFVSVLALAILVLALAPPVRGDVVHLRTGEAVKGRPVRERSNEAILVVEDYLSGALRRFAWEAVEPVDRERIKRLWGLTFTGRKIVEGVRVELRLDDGSTTEIRGVIERETDLQLVIMSGGEEIGIDRSRIVSRDAEDLDVRDVWDPAQLVERFLDEMRNDPQVDFDALTAREHWRIAQYAEWVGALEVAAEHYRACAEDPEYLNKDIAADRLHRVEALLLNQAALETLREAKFKLRMKLFRKVREILDGFTEKHPDAGEEVLQKVEEFRADFNQRRTAYFQREAKRHFVDICEDLIRDKVREEDIAYTDVTSWTRRELPDAAFQILIDKYFERKDDVTPEEARDFWEGRPKRQWRKVTYGAGTFIVDPPKIKPPKRRRRGGRSSGRGGGAAPSIEIPKPPTRDGWWEEASTREREQFTLAWFVENSELFELGDREYRPCALCHGVGLLSETLSTGDVLSYLCTRCGGAQQDVVVKYR